MPHHPLKGLDLPDLASKWEALLDAVPGMVFFKDTANRFVQVNRAYAEAVGLPKEKIIGKSVSDFIDDPQAAVAYWENDREVIETGLPKRNITAAHITDAQRWLRTDKIPVRDDDGQIIGVAGLSVDITDMKHTEMELARRVGQHQALAELGQEALGSVDCDRLFAAATALVSKTIEMEYCHILEYRPSLHRCVPRAAVGSDRQFCHAAPCDTGPQAGGRCPICDRKPMVITDLASEQRLRRSFPLLERLGVVSGLAVVIGNSTKPFGILGAYTTRRQKFSRADIDFLQGIANTLALAVEQQRARSAIQESADQLAELSSRLIEAQEEERQRIFHALHDELGQSLALLKLQVRAVGMRLDPGQGALRASCKQMVDEVSGIIENVRRLCHDLTPAALEDIGLNAALQWLFEEFARYFGFRFEVHLEKVDHIFNRDAQLLIYRIYQEALTNIHKHAEATRVWAALVRRADRVICQVADNGKGMDPAQCLRRRSPGDGLGLAAMAERARMLGGHFELEARPGGGTSLRVTIPLETKGD